MYGKRFEQYTCIELRIGDDDLNDRYIVIVNQILIGFRVFIIIIFFYLFYVYIYIYTMTQPRQFPRQIETGPFYHKRLVISFGNNRTYL